MTRVVVWQAIASLLMLLPILYLNQAAFAGNTDGLFYSIILKLVSQHVFSGDLYPVWLSEANGDAGSPVLLFYNPLPYIITSILGYPIATMDALGWKRLLLGMFTAQWLAGIFAYLWLKRLVSEKNALYASLLFTVFPYKFIYIFLHINLAQIWAIVLLPLLMLAADDMLKQKPYALPAYALWLGLLAIIHLRTAVAFSIIPLAYVFVFSHRDAGILWKLFYTHLLALGLAASYLLPAWLNLGWIDPEKISGERFDYAANLSHKDVLLNFHYAVIAALVLGLLARIPEFNIAHGKKIYFSLAVVLVTTLLCLSISQPIWDMLTVLQFLQFPAARLHAGALIATTVLAAFFLEYCSKAPSHYRWFYSPYTLGLAVAIMTMFTLQHIQQHYQKTEDINWNYVEEMHTLNPILPLEYRTKWQRRYHDMYQLSQRYDQNPLAQITDGFGLINSRWDGHRKIDIEVTTVSPQATVLVRQIYLPQWRPPNIKIKASREGLIQFNLPKGPHKISLELQKFKGQKIANIITLLTSIAVTALFFFAFYESSARRRTTTVGKDVLNQ